MSRREQSVCRRLLNAAPILLAAAGIGAVTPVIAQQALLLRGTVDDEPKASLLHPRRDGSPATDVSPAPSQQDAPEPASPPAIQPGTGQPVASNQQTRLPFPSDDAALTTGTVRVGTIDSEMSETLDDGALRARPIEGLEKRIDESPYEASGIRLGTFLLKPTLEQGITATNNADSSIGGSDAILSETTLRLIASSDWDTGTATLDAFGTIRRSLSGDDVEDHEAGASGELVQELGAAYRVRATAGFNVRPESAASPVAVEGAASQPLRTELSAGLGLEKTIGMAQLGATASINRSIYGDASLEGGGTLSQEARNATLYGFELRGGYEISPALAPFVAGRVGRRVHDEAEDAAGYARSATQIGLRAGLAIDLGEKFSGEISAGWIAENLDDSRLETISRPSIEAKLEWSPMRGTLVGLTAGTTIESAVEPGVSGSVLYSGRLSVERQMRANLTGAASAGLGWRDYVGKPGHDLILDADLSLTWWLNRYAGLTVRARHQSVRSTLPDRDTDTDSVFLGLKLQR